MSIWSRLIGIKKTEDTNNVIGNKTTSVPYDTSHYNYTIIDIEVSLKEHKIHDIGALRYDGAAYHKASKEELFEFINETDYICGHNIIHHDAKYLFANKTCRWILVDTLYVSPLLFPERPYHRLVKDDKLTSEQINNPVNDCEKAKALLLDEIARWHSLPNEKRRLFASLLKDKKEFKGFLSMVDAEYTNEGIPELIKKLYAGKICQHADLDMLIEQYPCGLAYALALIDTTDYRSITPGWVLHNYPEVEFIVKLLRHTSCQKGCNYCNTQLDVHHNLKAFFGYEQFRTYEGEPLQEQATQAAVKGKSLLAIFPTGGGKSLTFQLPALMAGRSVHGLTVVISPLQSLMKDQVDNLADRGITDAVTINGMLDPITRALSIQRVQDGEASLLYISPEMLRSKTIEKILTARHVVRFVIDEAHCFSSWGQDFRVDYLYIGKFIREYQQKKKCKNPIPISCFTATAKQKVIQDICDYFKQTLNLELELFASTASRTNLRYSVIHADSDNDKYLKLRELVAESNCPTIVYVSRTKRTKELAAKLTRDGYKALPFNGKMEAEEKIANQDAFMNDQVHIIVATSAFGMGVDKKDVGLVVHYDISDSLENYVQEAGRAGRDPNLSARCYVLYSDNDLDKHFILLNQTKLSISEIQQIWKAIKDLTRQRMKVSCSALEIARKAGWDDSVSDIETRVRTALAALEQNGYLVRGNNVPHVYATGITVKNMDEARKRISASLLFDSDEIEKAVRIIKSLISQKHIAKAQNPEAESRIDYLADILGLSKKEVISVVERMRQEGILADSKDISAYLLDAGDSERKSQTLLERFAKLEQYILNHIPDESLRISCKQLNDNAVNDGINTSKEKDIRTLLYFLTIKGYTRKKEDAARKHEQLLMLTFSRAAATEFKQRLMELIGNAAHFVEIKTFHSYCFDLLGRIGNLEDAKNVVSKAAEMIAQGEVEPNKIGKTVLVIDEAQDMGVEEHALVKALMTNNEEMRVIAVGDDDQNIYEFRGSDSSYMYRLTQESGSTFVEMTENYRSARHPVDFANGFLKAIDKRIKSTPIISMRKEEGWVEVTRHQSKYMYQPLVENLLQHRDKGTSCVLTQTNEEAVILVALLREHGINCKLIQSMDGLRFWNMAEMRYFLRYIDKRVKTPLITEELWEETKHVTFSTYDRSLSLMYVKRCIEQFEQTNKVKYLSDFKEFIFESSVEDFCDVSGADVVVSTIHKAKGREFDDVYMLISDNYSKDAHLMRRYYVGITRTKNRLFVHTNGDCFNRLNTDRYFVDQRQYDMPKDVVLQLSHKDVYLGFFKERKQEVLALRGGDSLTYNNFFLYSSLTNKPVAKLSLKMQDTLSEWEERGYKVKSASVRFVVAWKPKDAQKDESETAVLLADLILSS